MSLVPAVPVEVQEVQRRASDPRISAWVAANAGAGKTHVLAQRVIRLLLDGCPPNRILCLTFTKAAAANMASRVFSTLAQWISLDDEALDAAIAALDGRVPNAERRVRARRLFAEALEAPGGLKVQTIHAFCARLLHQFPFEAEVAAGFTVLEDRAEAELIDRLRLEVLTEATAHPDGELGRALATAITVAADMTLTDTVREAIDKRAAVTAFVEQNGGLAGAAAELSRALDIEPDDAIERVEAEIVDGPLFPSSQWATAAATWGKGSINDIRQRERLLTAAAMTGPAKVDAYLKVFFTDDLAPRDSLITASLARRHPELAARLKAEQERLSPLLDRRRALATRDRTVALLTIAAAIISRYQVEKDRHGFLDYDDLIDKTLALFSKVSAAWVLYKLDLGIDHLLIDEAQDTSPKQWEVIKHLVSEFTAGEGARGDVRRTIFAVGDEKQSIFSFQGAAPHYFAEMRRHFERAYGDAFVPVDLKHSFRSAPVVLGAVDSVFSRPQAYTGLTADSVKTVHQAVREKAPGVVEIWPLVQPDERREIEGWDAPFDVVSETSPFVRLAKRIARTIRVWLARGEPVTDLASGKTRPLAPGDILILVHQRGALFEAIIRALKEADIAVAGADRLMLTEHIAVMDLMALGDALLLPADDLALATVLKSPLFGITEERLFALAWQREGTLRAALRAKASDDPLLSAIDLQLERLATAAAAETPFAFYARVLGPEGGRKRLLARLGPEAADALDEFLNLALDYERRETASLQGFLAWLRATPTEIKRDMELAREEVRVMTVHGAKGLEAPLVILADTTTNPAGPHPPRLLTIPDTSPGKADRIVWAVRKAMDVPVMAQARARAIEAAQNEYRRLLYVAMTRAADRLVVCGAEGQRRRPEGCWYDLVRDALAPDMSEEAADDGDGTVLRLRKPLPDGEASPPAPPAPATRTEVALPNWLRQPAAAQAEQKPVVSVSAIGAAASTIRPQRQGPAAAGAETGRLRGILIHRLLQALPELAPDRRPAAARRYLERAGAALDPGEQERLLAQVLAVIADARFSALFAAGSGAEVPIVGRVVRKDRPPLTVSGQVDRLAVTPKNVLIADYKSDSPAPQRIEDVDPAYLVQLALYRAVLDELYPDRAVRAAIVWTEVPAWMELPEHVLETALNTAL